MEEFSRAVARGIRRGALGERAITPGAPVCNIGLPYCAHQNESIELPMALLGGGVCMPMCETWAATVRTPWNRY